MRVIHMEARDLRRTLHVTRAVAESKDAMGNDPPVRNVSLQASAAATDPPPQALRRMWFLLILLSSTLTKVHSHDPVSSHRFSHFCPSLILIQ